MKKIRLSDSMDNLDPAQLDNMEARGKMDNKVSAERIKQRVFNIIGIDGVGRNPGIGQDSLENHDRKMPVKKRI